MKLLGMLLSLVLLNYANPSISIIDTNLKNPVTRTDDFTVENFINKQFPVYSDDIKAVNEATDKVVKMIEANKEFNWDSVKANRSVFVLKSGEENYYKVLTIRIVTHIKETGMWYNFELVKKESNIRKAQRRLLDFASYLSN